MVELRALCFLPLGPASSPFCSGYFGDRILLFAQDNLDHEFPILGFPL
jgi:hypothetical protein